MASDITTTVDSACNRSAGTVLQAIRYTPSGRSPAALEILDQLALPHRSTYEPISSCKGAWNAIKQMKVRGAPAIAIVAALSLAVELSLQRSRKGTSTTALSTQEFIWERLEYLKSSRATAVNLGDAVGKLKAIAERAKRIDGADGYTVATAYIEAAEKMLTDDVKSNKAIGMYGAEWIKEHTAAGKRKIQKQGELKVITHCNTGCVECPGIVTPSRLITCLPGHLQQLVMEQRSA
jgi:methylthioribose-1-phosphate isomerase